MKVLDFKRKLKQKQQVGIATKMDLLIRKATQFLIDHDFATGNLDSLQGIQSRVNKMLDERIKSVADIDRFYKLATQPEGGAKCKM